MSIYINKDTKLITQGITGKTTQSHTKNCQDSATAHNCYLASVHPTKTQSIRPIRTRRPRKNHN